MGFTSPHGLHIPIVTITRNTILLVKRHICDIGNQFQGLNLIDTVLPAWWIFDLQGEVGIGNFIVTMMFIVFTLQTMPGQYHYNPIFPCELRFTGDLFTSDFFKTKLCINVFHLKLKISYHEYVSQYWISYFTDKIDAYFWKNKKQNKTWSDNRKHVSNAYRYFLTVVYNCTRLR